MKQKPHMITTTKKIKTLALRNSGSLSTLSSVSSQIQLNFYNGFFWLFTSISLSNILMLLNLGLLVSGIMYCLSMLIHENVTWLSHSIPLKSYLDFRSLLVTYALLDTILIPFATLSETLIFLTRDYFVSLSFQFFSPMSPSQSVPLVICIFTTSRLLAFASHHHSTIFVYRSILKLPTDK